MTYIATWRFLMTFNLELITLETGEMQKKDPFPDKIDD